MLQEIVPFLPAGLAAVTDVLTALIVLAHQPDYPENVVVFQILMVLTALLSAVPNLGVRFVGFMLLMAGVLITGMSIGLLYLPTAMVALWILVRTPAKSR
jgi:hypothetical protein